MGSRRWLQRVGGLAGPGPRARALATLALVGSPLLLVSGCTKYDRPKIERAILDDSAQQRHWPVRSVECPAQVELRKGDTFVCVIHFEDDQRVDAEVLQEDDAGNFRWAVKARVEPMADVLGRLQKQLPASASGAKVTCDPRAVLISRKGEQLACTAETPAGRLELDVRVEDDEGKLSIKAKP
ncbi:MAG: DUF4333 domain-containing protein [Polyangiaceae bacterium]|nr:DUF4333 domain-containing protein [Polyangiaceae bacterium]